ncbi:MAG: hypothetical protein ACJASD_000959 [Sphingomonas echinoides]|jgi:hypothetical protein
MATPEPAAKAATKAPAHRHAFTAWMTATVSATAAFYKYKHIVPFYNTMALRYILIASVQGVRAFFWGNPILAAPARGK